MPFSLFDRLRTLHSTDITQLSEKHTDTRVRKPLLSGMVTQYAQYLFYTWGNVLRSIVFLSLDPVDLVVVLLLAVAGSIILGVSLVICAFLNFSVVQKLYANWQRKTGHNLSLVNEPSNIFREITQAQVDAARTALKGAPVEPKPKGAREFNVDIAKLLLQLSALMYERGAGSVRSALAATHAHARLVNPDTNQDSEKPSPSSTIHDLVSPPNGHSSDPAQLLENLIGLGAAEAISERLSHSVEDNAIRDFCRSFGLEYAPVSELNASDSAYVALFWDPNANWIVVAFKGTSPAEYTEWVSDFKYNLVHAGDWLPGFAKVHEGFLRRIFPDDVSLIGGIRPWDTIIAGVKLVSDNLRTNTEDPNAKINVYFTGHSLGCAIASLAYARAVLVEKDLGEHVVLRDGYLFAAPIVCDIESVQAFNGAINKNYDTPKTLWRVTNMEDIVATGLPEYGDKKGSRFLNNSLLNFAHLGAEIRMRSKPHKSAVNGWPHITPGLPVLVTSSFPADLVGTLGTKQGLPQYALDLEKLPIIGRFVQHAAVFYWDQLQRMGVGPCLWIDPS